jgi:hypothetical protein
MGIRIGIGNLKIGQSSFSWSRYWAQQSIFTDGTDTFRKVIRGDNFCTDIALTPTGFSGTENVDWANVESISLL